MTKATKLVQISESDLRWLIENTIREICIQDEEYSNSPQAEDAERILRLISNIEFEFPKEYDIDWLLNARK